MFHMSVNIQSWHTVHIFINIDIFHIWSASHRASTLQVKTSSSNFISIALHSYMCGTGLSYAPFVLCYFFVVFILWKWIHLLLLECFIPFMVFFFLFRRLYGQIHFLVFGIRLICPLAPWFASQLYTVALFLDSFLNLNLFYFWAFL